MSDSELLLQLAESVQRLSGQMDGLLQLHRRPLGFQPDRLQAQRIQVRRNRDLDPKTCLQIWDREAKQLRACPSNKLTLLLSGVRSQRVQGGGKSWEELIISGYAGGRTGWVDLVSTLGGLTSDALLASLLVFSDADLALPVTFSFRPAEASESVVLVWVGNARQQWADGNPARQQWQKNSKGMLAALQTNLRRALDARELPHESFVAANRRLRYGSDVSSLDSHAG